MQATDITSPRFPAVIGNKLMGTSPLGYTDFTPLNILARE